MIIIVHARVISSIKLATPRQKCVHFYPRHRAPICQGCAQLTAFFTMPTTRSASNAKKASSSRVDASLRESGEEPSSPLSDVDELIDDDDLQVCNKAPWFLIQVGLRCKNTFAEPYFRSATWNSESQEDSGRHTSKKSAT
jgi:hypothetical protein